MPELALLDGHSIAYRAYFALPDDLQTQSGQVTNAIYGFTRMLIKLLGERKPDRVAVAWDVSRRTFRTEQYSDYKAQRAESPDAFRSQLPLIREILTRLGIPQIDLEGFEADDLIASISARWAGEGWDVVIVTGDRDAFQLVDERRRVLYMKRGISDTVLADASYVETKYGIPPTSYVEFAALRGDNSDNLPGVPGVGEKTAAKLIAGYGTLEGVFQHLDEQTPKLRENLTATRDQVFLNRTLMTLVSDLDIALPETEGFDPVATRELFTGLEFGSIWPDLVAVMPGAVRPVAEPIDCSTTFGSNAEIPAVGTLVCELVSDDPADGMAVLTGEDSAVVVDPGSGLLEGRAIVAHDAKRILKAASGSMPGVHMDTALAAYLVDPGLSTTDLAELVDRYLGLELVSPDRDASPAQGTLDFSGDPDIEAAGRRAVAIQMLYRHLIGVLEDHEAVDLINDVELPLVAVLARMELAGIGVDREYLLALGGDLRTELAELERSIHGLAGEAFNINSSGKLAQILFEKLGLPVIKKTATGKPSTDASVLEKLDHPLVGDLLRYRELEKLRSTYVDGYLPLIRFDGRIHTTFNQMASTTGRLSSESPNLQNIPVRSETGRLIRRAFIPAADHRFIVADYSQIELRVLAHMSQDSEMVAAFKRGDDIHTATAARVFAVASESVTGEMRRMAKVINFGLLYGMEAYGLAERLGIDRSEAQAHIEVYFAQFPGVKAYLDGVVSAARRDGYTQTMFGRRRYLAELKSDNFRVRQMGERMALNAPIQGTAADIIKLAMIGVDARLAGTGARLLLQIHDELVVEAPREKVDQVAEVVKEVMESAARLDVPLEVDLGFGDNLAETKAV